MIFTVADILDSGGLYPERAKKATAVHITNAQVLCDRVNRAFAIIGVTKKPQITSGLRLVQGVGAPKSAHLEGRAVDFIDPGHAIAHALTRVVLLQCKLRREDTDCTRQVQPDGTVVEWCHLDIRLPYGVIFKP